MKANIEPGDNEWFMTLIPETQDDGVMIGVMGRSLLLNQHRIYCQEIGYMQPNIQFIIERNKL